MEVNEVVVYDRALTPKEVEKIVRKIRRKWAPNWWQRRLNSVDNWRRKLRWWLSTLVDVDE